MNDLRTVEEDFDLQLEYEPFRKRGTCKKLQKYHTGPFYPLFLIK